MGYMSFAEYLDNYIREMLYAPIRAEEEAAMIRDREYRRREYIARRLGWRTPKDEARMMCYIARGGIYEQAHRDKMVERQIMPDV